MKPVEIKNNKCSMNPLVQVSVEKTTPSRYKMKAIRVIIEKLRYCSSTLRGCGDLRR